MDGTVWIDAEIQNETDKAWLIMTDEGTLWVPKSQVGGRKKDESGTVVRVEVAAWWARKNGLADDKDEL